MKNYIPIILIVLFTLMISCYTTFNHPIVNDELGAYRVNATDDCQECHENGRIDEPVLVPHDAMTNDAWQFYHNSPWWQDTGGFYNDGSTVTPDEMRVRQPNMDSGDYGQVSTYSGGGGHAVSILGKENSSDSEQKQQEPQDTRRSFGTRQTTKSEKSSESAPKRRSRN